MTNTPNPLKKTLQKAIAFTLAVLFFITPVPVFALGGGYDLMVTFDRSNLMVTPSRQVLDEAFDITVKMDGEIIGFSPAARFFDGVPIAPVEPLFNAFGIDLDFDRYGMAFVYPDVGGYFAIGRSTIFVWLRRGAGGAHFSSLYTGGVLYAPINSVALAFGHVVDWDAAARTVHIVPQSPRITSPISAGANHSFAITEDGAVWGWGFNRQNRLIGLPAGNYRTPQELTFYTFEDYGFISVNTFNNLVIGIRDDGRIMTWGDHMWDIETEEVIFQHRLASASAGHDHGLIVDIAGNLWSFGYNRHGQLGDGTTQNRFDFGRVEIPGRVVYAAAGNGFSLAVTSQGELWAWGRNFSGQLGDGTREHRHSPVRVKGNVTAVAAGENHSLALTADGAVWAWGSNTLGSLGIGTDQNNLVPNIVMRDATAVSAGRDFSHAITTDGTLWGWGSNSNGQVGDGTSQIRRAPVKIMEKVAYVSGGVDHALAVTAEGVLWAWGNSGNGQLGAGSTRFSRSPVRIMDGIMVDEH